MYCIANWSKARRSFARWSRSNRASHARGDSLVSWSFTTLAVAAKNIMASVPTYMELETAFTLLQFAVVGPLIALAHRN